MNDKEYWESFYKNYRSNSVPSTFAEYVAEAYLESGKKVLELGCGNGRDSLFFASEKQMQVSAIDQATEEIEYLRSISKQNPTFFEGDFTDLSNYTKFDYLYTRFTLHSITEHDENKLFSQIYDRLNDDGLFLAEARSKKDENQAKYFSKAHYRRYLDFEKTVVKIEKLGFDIIEKIESQGLAIYKSEDPFVLRIVARKRTKNED